jgi:hypothetical protein
MEVAVASAESTHAFVRSRRAALASVAAMLGEIDEEVEGKEGNRERTEERCG